MLNNIEVVVKGGTMTDNEKQAYVDLMKEKHPDRIISKLIITIINDKEVDLEMEYSTKKFSRIRRITGYLVGTLDRFNNAKRVEVADRVKHDVTMSDFKDVYVDAAE